VHRILILIKIIALSLIFGCSIYHPMPITQNEVYNRLQPSDMTQIKVLASEIKHPILHPVQLHPDEGLSPDGAAVLAVLLNPSLRAFRDQKALSNAQILEAGLLPNPQLTYSLDLPTDSKTSGTINAFGLGMDWNVTSLITRASKVRGAKMRGEAIDLDIAWREWQVAQGAKTAVYQLTSLRYQIVLLKQISQQMMKNLVYIQKAVLNGFMTASDMTFVQVANSSMNEQLLLLEKKEDQQRLKLLQIIGFSADSQIHLSKNIYLPSKIILPKTSLVEGLEQRRLDLLALRRGYDSQEATVRVAVLEQFPEISIGSSISRDTDNLKTTGFGLTIELPIFNRGQGKIAVERATRKKLYDEYVARVFDTHSDIEKIKSGIRFLNEQIATAQTTEVNFEKLFKSYQMALSDGRINTLVYYRTWNSLIDAQIKVIDLKGQLAQAVVALELATGLFEIPGSAQSSDTVSTKSSLGENNESMEKTNEN